ncbi:Putative RNA lariat debranching enzyme [[Torrubiella] hemipterigena]|uniref:Putative RNA lariat debranching enzyme n=1 Tax=[Torrubiella] hemipterigena TaxID=1531966 RepID=A0A0A1TC15_9HYPO|nr:Putative RNA lariat debranching enzyme [[Torrubiella] hemipterigena]
MGTDTRSVKGVRIAIEGCGHGTLDAIYASIESSYKARGWDGVDLVIIGGDFQSVRDAADLSIMSCPVKYRHLGDFPDYYSGKKKAPFTTVFIAGNHEASSHLWELYYGGWVAPNIYYLGAANVIRFGPLRIAALSGIWSGHDYRKPHLERLPFTYNDVKSFYHVREYDVRKLLQIRTQVDIGLSHDWPRGIERHGNSNALFKKKPFFRQESLDGTLGSVAADYVLNRLRPPYWFSAHMHVKFAALKKFDNDSTSTAAPVVAPEPQAVAAVEANPDEIDLDMDDDDDDANGNAPDQAPATTVASTTVPEATNTESEVSDALKAQLPASFFQKQRPKGIPGQPVPETIFNKEVRFLALDKCLPGRSFLQLCDVQPHSQQEAKSETTSSKGPQHSLQYDPEWLAIVRVFHTGLVIGDPSAKVPEDEGEEHYASLIDAERKWVEEHIVQKNLLDVPNNFEITAPPYVEGTPEIVTTMPEEYTNPQTETFCNLLGIKNIWDSLVEERQQRRLALETTPEMFGEQERSRFGGGRGGGRGGRGGGRGRGGRGGRGGPGRGRGGFHGRY